MLYHYFDNLFTKLKHLLLYYPFLNVTKIANIIEAMRPKKGWEMCIKAAQAAEFLGDIGDPRLCINIPHGLWIVISQTSNLKIIKH